MKIVVLDGFTTNPGDLSWDGLKELGDVEIYDRTFENEVFDHAKDAEILLTNKVRINKTLIERLEKLKYIGVMATGYNIVDIQAATEKKIIVTNVPAYSTESVCQMTFSHILNITNRVGYYAYENKKGRWSHSIDFCYWDTPLKELYTKTMGIVGLGNIGSRVASIACKFGMDVFAVTSKNASDLPNGIKKTTLEGLFSVSDIISLHCPLNDKTYHMIDKHAISKMRKGTIIINTSRGELVDDVAVASALNSGFLGGYGADVISQEPPLEDNILFSAKNAFITPHIAWATVEARKRMLEIVCANIKAFIKGKPQNVI